MQIAQRLNHFSLVRRREPLRSRLPLVQSTTARTFTPPKSRLHADADQPEYQQPRRSGGAALGCFGEHGVQPRVKRCSGAICVVGDKSDARAQRFASFHSTSACFRSLLFAASRSSAVQRLFFGDFLLAPQKKVTPPPGGTPGNAAIRHPRCGTCSVLGFSAFNQTHELLTQAFVSRLLCNCRRSQFITLKCGDGFGNPVRDGSVWHG